MKPTTHLHVSAWHRVKKQFLSLAIVLLSTPSTLLAQHEVVLSLNLRNMRDTDTLTLSWGANNKSVTPLITTLSPASHEEITLPLNEPRLVLLGLKGQTDNLELLLAPGENVSINGRLRNGRKSLISRLHVSGAAYQEEYIHAVRCYTETSDSINEQLHSDYKDITSLLDAAKQNHDEQGIASIYQSKRGKEYIERTVQNFHEHHNMLGALVNEHRNSFMAPLLMLRLMGRLSKNYREMYNSLGEEAKASYYGREVKDEVYPPSLVGDIAPTVTVRNVNGEEKLLSFIHHNNRFLLLDFWASWCQPCHKEIPNLRALYDKYHAKGLDIIGISADHSEDDWKATVEEMKEPWCNYIDVNRQAITEYKVQYIPSIFIIDAEGYIIAEKLRGKELSDFIDRLFAR